MNMSWTSTLAMIIRTRTITIKTGQMAQTQLSRTTKIARRGVMEMSRQTMTLLIN